MRRGAAVLAVLAGLVAAGCGGAPVDQVRRAAPFDRLDVSGGIHVVVARGDRPGVTVHGRADVIDRVHTDVSGGTLRVGVRDRGIVIGPDPMNDVRVQVTAPRLQDVQIHGDADIDLGDVRADQLRFQVQGTGELSARGSVGRLDTVIHGAGHGDFSGLTARDARVEIHGAGEVALDVAAHLDVEIRGAGDVTYRGSPIVTQSIHGAGDVSRVGP